MRGVTGQHAQEAQVATVVAEKRHRHAVLEACRQQELPPGARLTEGHGEGRRRHGWLEPVEPQRFHLLVGLREGEVTEQRVGVSVGADPAMDLGLRVAHRQPGGVVRDHLAQATQQPVSSLFDASRRRPDARHLGAEHIRAHAVLLAVTTVARQPGSYARPGVMCHLRSRRAPGSRRTPARCARRTPGGRRASDSW